MEQPAWSVMRGGRHRVLGYRMEEMAGGHSVVSWTPTEELTNPVGMVHGGWLGLLVDDVCGMAVQSMLSDWRPFPTASMHINFLRGVKIGPTYRCDGIVVRAGRRLTVADCTVESPDGELLLRGTCTFALDLSDTDLAGYSALERRNDQGGRDGSVQQG